MAFSPSEIAAESEHRVKLTTEADGNLGVWKWAL